MRLRGFPPKFYVRKKWSALHLAMLGQPQTNDKSHDNRCPDSCDKVNGTR